MLYLRHHDMIYGFVRHHLFDPTHVDDVVQDVFEALLKDPRGYRQEAAFSSYLCRMALNKIADRGRRIQRERKVFAEGVDEEVVASVADDSDTTDVLRLVGRREAQAHLQACIDKLPDAQRDALFWTYFQDERDHEVAVRQQVSQGTVKSRLNAARQALKRCLSQRASGGLHV